MNLTERDTLINRLCVEHGERLAKRVEGADAKGVGYLLLVFAEGDVAATGNATMEYTLAVIAAWFAKHAPSTATLDRVPSIGEVLREGIAELERTGGKGLQSEPLTSGRAYALGVMAGITGECCGKDPEPSPREIGQRALDYLRQLLDVHMTFERAKLG
jgi:hypothetical protein